MKFKVLIKVLICFSYFSSLVNSARGQAIVGPENNADNSQPYISWVKQYPFVKEKRKTPKIIAYLYERIFGKSMQYSLARPVAVWAANPSRLVVLDQQRQTVFEIENKKVSVPRGVRKKDGYFASLVCVCSKPDDEILFTDSRLSKIFTISSDKKKLRVLNDSLTLQQPTGIAYSAINHEIWVVETNAHRISILNEKGELIKTIGSRGVESGQFNFPTSIWIDKAGLAYVVDAMNFRVQIFNAKGEFVSTFGEEGDVSGTLARPKGIATDSYGNIYVVDGVFHVVQIFDKAGNYLYKFGGKGNNKEEFWVPTGIYIDQKDYIYVADSYNSRIQIFHLNNGRENEKNEVN